MFGMYGREKQEMAIPGLSRTAGEETQRRTDAYDGTDECEKRKDERHEASFLWCKSQERFPAE